MIKWNNELFFHLQIGIIFNYKIFKKIFERKTPIFTNIRKMLISFYSRWNISIDFWWFNQDVMKFGIPLKIRKYWMKTYIPDFGISHLFFGQIELIRNSKIKFKVGFYYFSNAFEWSKEVMISYIFIDANRQIIILEWYSNPIRSYASVHQQMLQY